MPPIHNLNSISVDHAACMVQNLHGGSLIWQRLGFLLTPISRQRGSMPGKTDIGEWATANRCAVFESGYIELIGLVNATLYNPWETFLRKYEGMHLLALRIENAEQFYESSGNLKSIASKPVARQRELDVNGSCELMRFTNIFSLDRYYPEGRYVLIEHKTPDFLWQKRYQTHPNGAKRLKSIFMCAENIEYQCKKIFKLIGEREYSGDDFERIIELNNNTEIIIYQSSHFFQKCDWLPGQIPGFAGVDIAFQDLHEVERYLQTRGVPVRRAEGDVWVEPRWTNGFILKLSQY